MARNSAAFSFATTVRPMMTFIVNVTDCINDKVWI